MAKQQSAIRGVYEKIPGSGVWWVHVNHKGVRRREKVGSKAAAVARYQKLKTEARQGSALPTQKLNSIEVTLSTLIDDAIQYAKDEGHKDIRGLESKRKIVSAALGARPAAELTAEEIRKWLTTHTKSNGNFNRYKAFISLCYRVGIQDTKKVKVNPCRDIRQRKESAGRLAFLTQDQYKTLYTIITERFPEHLDEYVVSVHTGMRASEQYTVEWPQYDDANSVLKLNDTKNGSHRDVHLNATAKAAIERRKADALKRNHGKLRGAIFPREKAAENMKPGSFQNRWFEKCVTDAKITDYTWHSNRHTFCSWLAMTGAGMREIQAAAGHKTVQMAARYSHLSPEHKQSVVNRIG